MSITEKLAELNRFAQTAPASFHQQIERARQFQSQFAGKVVEADQPGRGMDRSRELAPVQRPTLLRKVQAP